MADRNLARSLAGEHLSRNDPTGWFEALYRHAAGDTRTIPWADQKPNPHLVAWLKSNDVRGDGKCALVIGCGLGDDAEALAASGLNVTAFDIAPTAVEWCRKRFPESKVNYEVADLLNVPAAWSRCFDFIFEAYTLQALPPELHPRAITNVANLLAPGGTLLVVCRAREESDPTEGIPWPLTRRQLDQFESEGLKRVTIEDFIDWTTNEPKRRFRAVYTR